ncbi:hypothetical protein Tco_1262886 [Tanacetum coccineum]
MSKKCRSAAEYLRHLDRLNPKNCKKYRVGGVPISHGEDIDEGVLKTFQASLKGFVVHLEFDLEFLSKPISASNRLEKIGKQKA